MKSVKHFNWLFSFLLVLILLTNACKKDEPTGRASTELYGTWSEDLPFSPAPKVSRGLMFSRDSIYFIMWDHTSRQVTYVNGTYLKQGNNLITDFKEVVVRQNNDFVISRSPASGKYFDKATFKLDGYKLIINYTGYPSSTSLPSTITFNRFQAD
ncbi:MAG: hypothetical protein ACQUHE_13610 [Bacteroidia bacterium]